MNKGKAYAETDAEKTIQTKEVKTMAIINTLRGNTGGRWFLPEEGPELTREEYIKLGKERWGLLEELRQKREKQPQHNEMR
ncbi:MAG: hypothetical protein PHU42_02420 [Patescibacteria group bacterium]|nr:hypothetical protein [Patescibacteria group bacterium]